MKFSRYVVVAVVMLVALMAFSLASAQGVWTTGIDIQSLSDAPGAIVVEFFDGAGNASGQLSDTITAFGSLNFYLPNEPAPTGPGEYSAVVSADVEVAAAVSLQNYDLGGADIYLGTGKPEASLTFPLVYRNHTSGKWNSRLSVQNATASAQSVTLKLFTSGESTADVTKVVNIPGNASYTFDIAEAEYAAFGPFGSATVTGSDPLAGMAMSIRDPGTGKVNVIEASYRAFGSAQFGKSVVLPLVYKNFNLWTSGINIVNTGGTSTNVSIEYTNANPNVAGGPWTDNISIGANSMGVFYTPANATGLPDGFYGSAKITSATNDVLVVVASQRYRPTGAEGVAYEGSLQTDASGCVSLPVVHNRTSWKTGINILNTSASQASVTINYKSSAAGIPDASQTYQIAAASPLTVYMPSDGVTQVGFYGAADLKSTQNVLVNVANSRADRGVSSNYVGINYTCPAP
jgi:hypothetical protein